MSLKQFLNWPTVVSDWRSETGRLFQNLGPATWKARSPKPVWVRGISHRWGDIRWAKPTAANIWDKLAVVGQVARCWTIQRLVYEQSQLKLDTSPHRQPVEPSQDWSDTKWSHLRDPATRRAAAFWTDWSRRSRSSVMPYSKALQ